METLCELIPAIKSLGGREAILLDDGYRKKKITYDELYQGIQNVARRLAEIGLSCGDRLILWGENSPEWIIGFWACVQLGIVVVAVDARSSSRFVSSVIDETEASLLVFGSSVEFREVKDTISSYSFKELDEWTRASEGRLGLSLGEGRELSADDVVEIVYTSGTTGRPKGVPHRHRNLCANLRPFRREIEKYAKLAYPFQPIRILDMLPLSHMFGQSMGLFIPLFLKGTACFTPELRPSGIADVIRRNRISVLVVVPRLLRQMRKFLESEYDLAYEVHRSGILGVMERWWKGRAVHRRFGWKFWAMVIGGAAVKSEMEEFWSRIGILPVQGYGLTEASPVVAVNHPFSAKRGSLGKVVRGQDVKIANDGEILVRGESIVSEYLSEDAEGGEWLHTGDLGEIDEKGRLYYKGRKKDLIVTSEGRNVQPADVEDVLNQQPGVRDAAVVGIEEEGGEVVHAVLLLDRSVDSVEQIIRAVNSKLESEQRIRSWSVWPKADFPRTTSTMKVKRSEVAAQIEEERKRKRKSEDGDSQRGEDEASGGTEDVISQLLGQFSATQSEEIHNRLRLSEDLGISSLDRIDLLSRLEGHYAFELDEAEFTEISTVGQLRALVSSRELDEKPSEGSNWTRESSRDGEARTATRESTVGQRREADYEPPRWTRNMLVRGLRWTSHQLIILPLFKHYIELSVSGIDVLPESRKPAIFAANHASHLDTIAVYASLPGTWRFRVSPAIRKEYFAAYFQSKGSIIQQLWSGFQYLLAGLLFNVYPIPQQMGGIRKTLAYTGELLDRGYCPLIFPEGKRTPDGRLNAFQPGIGLMAVRLGVPVFPIYLDGLFEIMSLHDNWPRRGAVRIEIGRPLSFDPGTDSREAARRIEKAVRELAGEDH